MKQLKTLITVLLLTCVATSCQSKKSYIQKFEKFVVNVEQNCSAYTDEDWAGADAQFHAFTEIEYQKYQNKLTPEDRNQLGRLTARYAKVRYKSALHQASDYVDDVMDAVEGFVEEMEDDLE